jgi:hypothetical protein
VRSACACLDCFDVEFDPISAFKVMNAPIKGQQELEGIVSRTISAFIISRDDMLSNTFCQMGTAFFGHALGMIFMHRGDSPGESGSNVYFLADKKSRHEPCGMLFSKLSVKLADRALIITDGSNTGIKRLKAFHNQNIAVRRLILRLHKRDFRMAGLTGSAWAT